MAVFHWLDKQGLNSHSSVTSSQFTHPLVDLGAEEEVKLIQIFAAMKKAQLVILSILTTAILFCYHRHSLYFTKEKITSYNFCKFSCFQNASIALIILCCHFFNNTTLKPKAKSMFEVMLEVRRFFVPIHLS